MKKMAGLFIIAALSIYSVDAQAKSLASKEYDIGIQAGLLFPGTISIWSDYVDIDAETNMGFMVKAYGDLYAASKLSVGLYAQLSSTSFEDSDESASMFEIGFTLKGKIPFSSNMALKPGIAFGYRNLSMEDQDSGDGMALNGFMELQYAPAPNYYLSFELGFITQPVGGNADYWIAWGPMFYFLAGIGF